MDLVKSLFWPPHIMSGPKLFLSRRASLKPPNAMSLVWVIGEICGSWVDSILTKLQATNSILYRILFVFIGMSFFQGLICPSTSEQLVHASSTTASSPFTIGFTLAGWKSSAHFVNSIVLIAFVSAANGVIYIQSRTLYSLALKRKAPSFFAITNSRGGKRFQHLPIPLIRADPVWSPIPGHHILKYVGLFRSDVLANNCRVLVFIFHLFWRYGGLYSMGFYHVRPA